MPKFAVLVFIVACFSNAFCTDSRTGIVRGKIVDETGHVPSGEVFILAHTAGAPEDAVTHLASDGSYGFTLAPGIYDIFISSEPFKPACRSVRVEEGKTATLDVTLALNTEFLEQLGMLHAPPVVFRGDCAKDQPGYVDWFRRTRLPYGEPYVATSERARQIVDSYAKVRVQMSIGDVESLLGRPDFTVTMPPARLATQADPQAACRTETAYILKKLTENMADTADVAIYFFFTAGGQLYWAVPQNLPNLHQLGAPN